MTDFYGTAQGLKDYMLARGLILPVDIDTDPEIVAGLLLASENLDATFSMYFDGMKTGGRVQVREWPRLGHSDKYNYLISSNEIPREIENATYELAMKHFDTPGSLTLDYTPSKFKSVSVDGAISVSYAVFSSHLEIQKQFASVLNALSSLFSDKAQSSSLSGSVDRV